MAHFILKLICCIGGAVVLGCGITGIMEWWRYRPIKEEKERPFYIHLDLKEKKND